MDASSPEISDRGREILRDIVGTYISSGRPVSSRAISKHVQHGLSAASIRNVMADLEELGLIEQPHTSAGRVPTQAAYRLYVEALMQQRRLPAKDRRYIDEHIDQAASDVDHLMSVATHLLSELSHQVGVVLKPAVRETVLKTIDFLPLSEQRILCVVVSSDGFIDNVTIGCEEVPDRQELTRISSYLTDKFSGLTLGQIRDRLLNLMAEEKAQVDQLLSQAIELGRRALGGAPRQQGVLVEGTQTLLAQPELADVERIRRMLDTFADHTRLVGLLNRCMNGQGVRVFIGSESELTSELGFSLVVAPYGVGQRTLGSLGIIGPSRMQYSRVVALVNYLGETLSKALTAGSEA